MYMETEKKTELYTKKEIITWTAVYTEMVKSGTIIDSRQDPAEQVVGLHPEILKMLF